MPDWTDTLDARQAGTEPGFHSVHTPTEEHEDPIAEATGHQERLDIARKLAEEGRQPARANPVATVDPYVYEDEEPVPATEPVPPPAPAEPSPPAEPVPPTPPAEPTTTGTPSAPPPPAL